MRNINNIDKNILSIILKQDIQNMSIMCLLLKEMFPEDKYALFISKLENGTFLLYKDEIEYNKGMAFIVNIVSLLEIMEKEGYIYCVSSEKAESYILYKPIIAQIGITADNLKFDIDGGVLILEDKSIIMKDYSGHNKLNGICIEKPFANKISHYFRCYIYPCDTLRELAKNNYKSLEIISYEKTIRDAKTSRNIAWIALLLSLFLPFCMTFFNNKFSKTEIEDRQFDKVTYEIKCISDKVDSLCKYTNKQDYLNITRRELH